jgi:hypothetical protein
VAVVSGQEFDSRRPVSGAVEGAGDALIDAIDMHHEALAEDVLVEQIAASMLLTDAMTPSGAKGDTGVYVVHEDDVEVLARDALATIATHATPVAGREQEPPNAMLSPYAQHQDDRAGHEQEVLAEALVWHQIARVNAALATYREDPDATSKASLIDGIDIALDRLQSILGARNGATP